MRCRTRAALLLLAAVTAGCRRGDGAEYTPEGAARSFLEAVRRNDCEAAWRLFSTDTRSAIEEKAARYRSQGFGPDVAGPMRTDAFEPQNLYCRSTYHRYDPSSVRLVTVEGDHARVSVREGVPAGFLIPGFWPTKAEYRDQEMWLVRESDGWKVDRTHWPGVA